MPQPNPHHPPNILLITSDQQRADCIGYENPRIRTPHLDRLARDGARFMACITPNLVCQPARASILTGMLPLTHGVWDNGVDLDPALGAQGFAGRLAGAGYQTALIGKAHFSTKMTFAATGSPECRHSRDRYSRDWHGPYMGFAHTELAVLGQFYKNRPFEQSPTGHYERWFARHGDGEAQTLWGTCLGPNVGAAQTWFSALPAAWHSSTWVADRAMHFLEQRNHSRPFCLWASFPDPHHPFDCPEPWSRLYDPAAMLLPQHRQRDLERRPWWHKTSLESKPQLSDPLLLRFRSEASRMPDQSDEQLAHMTANYYGMISQIDHQVGRLISHLSDEGTLENTLIVYCSDHGEMLGNHGLYLKGPTPYEDLLRVPLVIRGPGVPAGRVVNEPVSTLDLVATLCDYAGVESSPQAQSRSLRDLLGRAAASREAAYSEWHVHPSRCGVGLQLRTVRTRTHKCTFELASGAGELYDLVNDPGEMDNRYDDPALRGVQRELEALMRARPGTIRDPLPEPSGMS
jgi:arylsulfatase A-like enzyme